MRCRKELQSSSVGAPGTASHPSSQSPSPRFRLRVSSNFIMPFLALQALAIIFAVNSYLVPSPSIHPPTLPSLLSTLSRALTLANATHFILPKPSLHRINSRIDLPFLYAFLSIPPSTRGITLGTINTETSRVLLAIASITSASSSYPISFAESHAGVRIFALPQNQTTPSAADYAEPYVDLFPHRRAGELLVTSCCNCAPAAVSVCMKSMCACQACEWRAEDVLPVVPVSIAGVQWQVPAPRGGGYVTES